jgi:hypothetical protein
MHSAVTSSSGTHWEAGCGAAVPVAQSRCCWWRQGMRAVEGLAVVAAAAAICSEPGPGQRRVLYRPLLGALREALQPPRQLHGALPRRCTTFPTPAPRFLPVPVDALGRPVDRQTDRQIEIFFHKSVNQSMKSEFSVIFAPFWTEGLPVLYTCMCGT